MCINQIFKDEQLAMMRFTRATDAREIANCEGQFVVSKASFASIPYPHRPFFAASRGMALYPSEVTRPLVATSEPVSMQGAA
ncbi:hypothetical protein [Novosphingobium resinovorum]|jgi:hypothetical protein|uniref:hypothetical protein n=1 Tax=Novosphingobium resinovorum TaxID=158500 RepID=UPI003D2E2F78